MRNPGERFPEWNAYFLDQSISVARVMVGDAGFLTVIQSVECPPRDRRYPDALTRRLPDQARMRMEHCAANVVLTYAD
jgi:hypothetical protein